MATPKLYQSYLGGQEEKRASDVESAMQQSAQRQAARSESQRRSARGVDYQKSAQTRRQRDLEAMRSPQGLGSKGLGGIYRGAYSSNPDYGLDVDIATQRGVERRERDRQYFLDQEMESKEQELRSRDPVFSYAEEKRLGRELLSTRLFNNRQGANSMLARAQEARERGDNRSADMYISSYEAMLNKSLGLESDLASDRKFELQEAETLLSGVNNQSTFDIAMAKGRALGNTLIMDLDDETTSSFGGEFNKGTVSQLIGRRMDIANEHDDMETEEIATSSELQSKRSKEDQKQRIIGVMNQSSRAAKIRESILGIEAAEGGTPLPGATEQELALIEAGDPKGARELGMMRMKEEIKRETAPVVPLKKTEIESKAIQASFDTANRELADIKKNLFDESGDLQETGLMFRWLPTKARETKQKMKRTIEIVLRARTGAAAAESEVENYLDLYMPSKLDTDEGAMSKIRALEEFIGSASGNGNITASEEDQGLSPEEEEELRQLEQLDRS